MIFLILFPSLGDSDGAWLSELLINEYIKAIDGASPSKHLVVPLVSFSFSFSFLRMSVLTANAHDLLHEKRYKPHNNSQTTLLPPIPNSYWATPLLCASEYPFSPFHFRPQLDKLLKAGIRTFIDLTEPNELIPYESRLRARARAVGIPDSVQLWYYRFPIRDRCTPPEDGETMTRIMSVLQVSVFRFISICYFGDSGTVVRDQECELANRKAVVHCRGGIGRTGTVVGSNFI